MLVPKVGWCYWLQEVYIRKQLPALSFFVNGGTGKGSKSPSYLNIVNVKELKAVPNLGKYSNFLKISQNFFMTKWTQDSILFNEN